MSDPETRYLNDCPLNHTASWSMAAIGAPWEYLSIAKIAGELLNDLPGLLNKGHDMAVYLRRD